MDFAPPDDTATQGGLLCYISDYYVRAVAPGTIVRSDKGTVILDLDNDGDESTGWTVLYLHLAEVDRVPEGVQVEQGDIIGRAACEGGFSTATHLHIARRFNGEWIPADCQYCPDEYKRPDFNMSGWTVVGFESQEYQGQLQNATGELRNAEQGRFDPSNRVSW